MSVPDGTCRDTGPIDVTCPTGLFPGARACYEIQFHEAEENNPACYKVATGAVVGRFAGWLTNDDFPVAYISLANDITGHGEFDFNVSNSTLADSLWPANIANLNYQIMVVPSDGDTVGVPNFRLNGLPPGIPVTGTVRVQGAEVTPVHLSVDVDGVMSGRFYDVLFMTDLDGGHVPDPVASVGLSDGTAQDPASANESPQLASWIHDARDWIRVRPNPFAGATGIDLDLPAPARVEVAIHDASGRRVRRLDPGMLGAGVQRLIWDGKDENGHSVPGGIYFVQASREGSSVVRKLTVVR